MAIRLRGHHLLCLLGYRGMGYSQQFTANMTEVYNTLRQNPDTYVKLVEGPDDLCAHYPHDKPVHCEEENVNKRDLAILERLELRPGMTLKWANLRVGISNLVNPEDIARFCSSCPWRPYGVCEAGVANLRQGKGLVPLPE